MSNGAGAGYQYRGLYRSTKIPPCIVDANDLRRLYRDLAAKTTQAIERQFLEKPENFTHEQFEALKAQTLADGTLTVTIIGARGEQLVSRSVEGLADSSLPEKIAFVTFDSAAALEQAHNFRPLNRFTLRLDFTEPPTFDSYDPWEQATPNKSLCLSKWIDSPW
ncbi:MAG TPA: hypothetical protein VHI98_14055 [Vicinamibacterales bacterium]|nr:hypothetical protein [Vicinamibacterales bacterium]